MPYSNSLPIPEYRTIIFYMELTRDGKETIYTCVPGYVAIRGNSAAGSAAKDALDGDVSDELILFSDLKSRVNKHVLELWQSEFPENKLHQSFPHLNDCTFLFLFFNLFVFPSNLPPFPSLTRLLLALTTSPSLILPATLDSFLTQSCP